MDGGEAAWACVCVYLLVPAVRSDDASECVIDGVLLASAAADISPKMYTHTHILYYNPEMPNDILMSPRQSV